jgi:hypothetical protein
MEVVEVVVEDITELVKCWFRQFQRW